MEPSLWKKTTEHLVQNMWTCQFSLNLDEEVSEGSKEKCPGSLKKTNFWKTEILTVMAQLENNSKR